MAPWVQIMLKDMADSKRTNHNVHRLAPQDLQPLQRQRSQPRFDELSATVISSLYWPPHPVSAASETVLYRFVPLWSSAV